MAELRLHAERSAQHYIALLLVLCSSLAVVNMIGHPRDGVMLLVNLASVVEPASWTKGVVELHCGFEI